MSHNTDRRHLYSYKGLLIATLIFFVGTGLSLYLWQSQRQSERQLAYQRFLQEANTLEANIQRNLDTYSQLLSGILGLFNGSKSVEQEEWNAYISSIKKSTVQYPGLVSIDFALYQPDKEVVAYSSVFKLDEKNHIGLDWLKFPNRKMAIQKATQTGKIELASQLHAIIDKGDKKVEQADKLPYFGLFGAVYHKDSNQPYGHASVEIDFYSMITRLFGGMDKGVLLKVYFKAPNGANNMLYGAEQHATGVQKYMPPPLFSRLRSIDFNKTIWEIEFYSTPTLEATINKNSPAIVFFSCMLITFLGSIVAWSLNTVNERSDLLKLSNARISMLNKELEGKVFIRTKELEIANNLLKKNNKFINLKNELISLMQSCESIKEVMTLVGEFSKRMFPENSGRIYCYNRNSLLFDLVNYWGDDGRLIPKVMKMSDCFALHYFHVYQVKGMHAEMICEHRRHEKNKSPYICIPIIDSESIFGLITMHIPEEIEGGIKEELNGIEKSVAIACVNLDLKRQLQYDAIHDSLTGLYNRRYFEESLQREIMKSHRIATIFNILMIDVDNFKKINDQYGHQMGDEVLKQIARMLKHDVRVSDVACRFGGEEFIVLLETSEEYGYKRAEQLRKKVEALTFYVAEQSLSGVTISIGLAVYPKHANNLDELIKNADEALYKAKSLGKNRTIIFGEWHKLT